MEIINKNEIARNEKYGIRIKNSSNSFNNTLDTAEET